MIKEHISLKQYNTFGIDVKARYFARIQTVDSLREVLSGHRAKYDPILILGGGSNILLTKNYEGLVLKNDLKGREILVDSDEEVIIRAGAGENWHDLVIWTLDKGLGGLENLSLIPGNVGASPMQNIGAYGVEIKDIFVELKALNRHTGEVEIFRKEDCKFGYRESVFKRALRDQYVICSVDYRLSRKPVFNIEYGAIRSQLEDMKVEVLSSRAISNAVIAIRQSKLPDPKKLGNSGSFFKNPVIPLDFAYSIKKSYPDMPIYPVDEMKCKLAAGWLIEQAGWKGKTYGNYGVHKHQALVLVNYGDAKGQEIYALSEKIKQSIQEHFGVELEREVNII